MEHTSKELSERLWNKGFRAEHGHEYRIFTKQLPTSSLPDHVLREVDDDNDEHGSYYESIPAYTFSELWAVVPYMLHINNQSYELLMAKDISLSNGPLNEAMYRRTGGESELVNIGHKSPAEALGLMVEWLIDNGHMEASNEDTV